MLIVYYKSDGEIYKIATGYESLDEFFGDRSKELSMVYAAIYIPFNDFIFRNPFSFTVDNNKVIPKDEIKHMFNI